MKKSSSTLSLAGGLVAGLAASLCCIGPLISLGLGFGSFAAAAWFEAWRPVFLGLTFGLLGLAWYLTYRRPKASCADGSCVRPPGRAARRVLWLGTIVALASALYPSFSVRRARDSGPPVVAPGDTALSVLIPSMDCEACAAGIAAMLRREPGVLGAEIVYATKHALVRYDPRATDADSIIAAIDRTGFKALRPPTARDAGTRPLP